MDPDVFFRMRRKDFQFKRKGFGDRLKYERELLKTVCVSIAAAGTGQYPVREALKVWGEEEKELSIEDIRVRTARHKLLFAKK